MVNSLKRHGIKVVLFCVENSLDLGQADRVADAYKPAEPFQRLFVTLKHDGGVGGDCPRPMSTQVERGAAHWGRREENGGRCNMPNANTPRPNAEFSGEWRR